ncbi:hypothetical protein [Streptomyces sp. NPDC006879]|uniref:hypothetical protein n=1 Tax=Streptomyces sp. NPDC006879 TaxID=3364767 RepID=UPI0036B1A3ED
MTTPWRTSAGVAAVTLVGTGVLLAAGPARASGISFRTECVPPAVSQLPPIQGETTVEVTAPATAEVGEEVEVVWKTLRAASKNPDILDLDRDVVKPSGFLKLDGAASGELAVTGLRKNPPIAKGGPMVLSEMTGRLRLTRVGEVTLTPDRYTINVSQIISTDTVCTPKEAVRAAATIKVTGAAEPSGGATPSATRTPRPSATASATSSPGSSATPSRTAPPTTPSASATGQERSEFPGEQVTVVYDCKPFVPDRVSSPVTVNARREGGSFDLTVITGKAVMNSPADLPAGALKPSMEIKLGGADSGTVTVTGPANEQPIRSGEPVNLADMTGTYKPGSTGKTTLSPGRLTIAVTLGDIEVPCEAVSSAVSLELDTAAQPGGTSGGSGGADGGSSGAGGASSGSAGGLADTGSAGRGGLRALGLVAGTVALLGAAVLVLRPRHRSRGIR